MDPVEPEVRAATVTHGSQQVTAAIARDNLIAVQFHPEKSSDNGLQILSNFVTRLLVINHNKLTSKNENLWQ